MRLKNLLLCTVVLSVLTGCGTETNSVVLTQDTIQNATIQSSKLKGEDKEKSAHLTEMLGFRRHDEWRATRKMPYDPKNPNSVYMSEPSYKTTEDSSWIRAHDGKNKVDIANTSYYQLPGDLKADYDVPNKVTIDLLLDAIKTGKALDQTFIEKTAQKTYAAAAKRNKSDISYTKLSAKEKDKYREIVKSAIDLAKGLDLIN